MNDDERREAIEKMAFEGDAPDEREDEVETDDRAMGSGDAPSNGTKKCPKCGAEVDAGASKCPKCGANLKTSSKGGEAKPSEKKSEDDTSVAPEEGADAAESRDDEDPDAAQAGTSGMTQNARERALSLLDLI
jgi:DNA-directed RNA polymerase subunit M/transcription elongation factor TFIIS